MNKKIFVFLILLLLVSFSTQAFASLTFTSNAITGTTASTIDLGTGNTLSLQTTTNAPITIGTGLVTLGGSLNVTGNVVVTGTVKAANIYESSDDSEGINNFSFGSQALSVRDLMSGMQNVALGSSAGRYISSGSLNTAIGHQTLTWLTTGSHNTAVGDESLRELTTGSKNTGVGTSSLLSLTTGRYNTAFGTFGLYSNITGTGNVALGYYAGYYETGSNTFYVNNSAQSNTANDKAYSLLYGTFSGTAGSITGQQLTINGNVGISTTTPTQKLEVNGGIRLNTATAKPTCDATVRGTQWVVQGGAGVADTAEICRKGSADTYSWVTIY